MKKNLLLAGLLLAGQLIFAGFAPTAQAYYLDTPHNESNGIYCYTCHTAEWYTYAPSGDVDDTLFNHVCLRCHDQAPVDLTHRGPAMKLHASSATSANHGVWSTGCSQCHDPHFQGQLDWDSAGDLWLAWAYFDNPGGVNRTFNGVDPLGGGYGATSISFDGLGGKPGWIDTATWNAKGGNADATLAADYSRGLVLVPNKANPTDSYEIVAVSGATIKVKGNMSSAPDNQLFGVVYGQSLRSRVYPSGSSSASDYRDVKFFQPAMISGSYGGPGDDSAVASPAGLCQVCHSQTLHWKKDGSGRGHENNASGANCLSCHQHSEGFAAHLVVNFAPTANAGVDQQIQLPAGAALDGSASSDPEKLPLTYQWQIVAGPAGSNATLSDPAIFNPNFVTDTPGLYTVELVVNDGLENSLPDQISITVTLPIQQPTISVELDPLAILSGDSSWLSWSATNTTEVFWRELPSGGAWSAWSPPIASDFLEVFPDVTTTYELKAVNTAGEATGLATLRVLDRGVLGVAITSPRNNTDSNERLIRVEGLVYDPSREFSVVVNGIWANQDGNYFYIDNLPLMDGANTITAVATGPYGTTASDSIVVTVDDVVDPNPLGFAITKPLTGATINEPFTRVEGHLAEGWMEVGITVNGVTAQVDGDKFFVNNLPLAEGENLITAVASDSSGVIEETSINVTLNMLEGEWIKLTLNPESGVVDPDNTPPQPFFATLTVEPHFENSSGDWTWELQCLNTSTGTILDPIAGSNAEALEHELAFYEPGVYSLYFSITMDSGPVYTGEMKVNVLDKGGLDSILRQKWGKVKEAWLGQDVEGGLAYFAESSKENYREPLNALIDELPGIVNDMQEAELVYARSNYVKYRIRRLQNISGTMVNMTYYLYFVRDHSGLWKVEQF